MGLAVLAQSSPSAAMLRLERVPVPGLGEVDLEIDKGELVALVGASGAGKSTLIGLLSLIERPSGGRLLVDGQDVGGLSVDARENLRRATIGTLPGVGALDESRTVGDNLAASLADARLPPEALEARIAEVLNRMRLAHQMNRRLGELSGGDRQRVRVARALVHDPRILLADEPTSGLDPRSAADLMRALAELRGRTAVVVVTEDPQVFRGARVVRLGASGYRR